LSDEEDKELETPLFSPPATVVDTSTV